MLHASRRRVAAPFVALLVPLVLACNESDPVGFDELQVDLVQPFTLWWPGQEEGAPFLSQNANFSAVANTRVYWSLRIEAIPRDPEDPRFRWSDGLGPPMKSYRSGFQDRILIKGWNRADVFAGRWPFAVGDVCTATLRYGPLLDGETERVTQIRFVIGGGLLEEEPATP